MILKRNFSLTKYSDLCAQIWLKWRQFVCKFGFPIYRPMCMAPCSRDSLLGIFTKLEISLITVLAWWLKKPTPPVCLFGQLLGTRHSDFLVYILHLPRGQNDIGPTLNKYFSNIFYNQWNSGVYYTNNKLIYDE